ncbi:amidohydrolase [Planctomycetes bacterium TBK1r]|uniref:N-substituted formamide deformylase n=1 Tax=Stieleria magnilauensis TaxID=2527963 RepID=A0ABX5XUP0_9BACT|nr:N-substituted formamide deformylase precursor [Planctomycetes bacterium TBK1r]
MSRRAAFVVLTLLLVSHCTRAADLVLRGGKIVTVDPGFRVVEAMAVRDGRIIQLGSDAEIASHVDPQTHVVDLQGRMVLPGLIDSHVHPTGASQYEADHEIPPMETIEDVLGYLRQRVAVVPKGEWIVLQQVFITRLREQRFPTRAELDSVAPDHPVWFRTGPDGSANSLALAENGIDKAFAAKHPQHVAVDPASGEPTGVIRQSSSVLKTRRDQSRKQLSQDELDDRLAELIRDYNRWGITGIIDRNCSDSARAQYARLLESGRLTTRTRLSRSLTPNADLAEIEQRLDEIASDPLFKSPDPRLGVIGVKVFEDGGMLTGSAYFTRPWGTSSIYGIVDPRYRGMQFIDDDRLEKLIRLCASRSLAFTAHCQGDAAVEALVAAYGRVNHDIPIAPTRSSITHSSFMSEKAIAGAAKLGVGVDLQPAWLYLDARTLVAQFGQNRLKHFIPLRSLFDAGVVAGGGSDHMQKIGSLRSVNPYNPFLGMWVAVTRTARWHDAPIHREQALTREQMLRFYTINNAWLMRLEEEIGSLEIGKRADFVVIDRDLLTCRDDEIRDTVVQSTWLDGQRVFQSQSQSNRSLD